MRSAIGSRDGLGGASLTSIGAVIGLGTTVTLPLALSGRGVGAFGIGAILTLAYAALVLANPLAGRIADRGRTRTLVVAALGSLTLVYLGIEMTTVEAVAVPLSFVAFCLTGMPTLAGNVLLSRAATHASLDQTVSQTLATLAWAPAAIIGSVTAGAVSSPDAALVVLAVLAASAAGIAALERVQRHRPQIA